jgi:hypothetical protein
MVIDIKEEEQFYFKIYQEAKAEALKIPKDKIDRMSDNFNAAETDSEALEIIFTEDEIFSNPFLAEYYIQLKNEGN